MKLYICITAYCSSRIALLPPQLPGGGCDRRKRDSLMKGLDGFLERDRELFDLPHKENENGNNPS